MEEIEDGTMGSLLIESDFDTEKTVSPLLFTRLSDSSYLLLMYF